MSPVDAQRWVRDVMEKTFPLGVCCDRTKKAEPRPEREPAPALEKIPRMLGVTPGDLMGIDSIGTFPPPAVDLQVRVAGFGGQGVLLLGEVLAEAGLDAGLEVSWLPSYGPEMRSGTSNCHVRLARTPIDSPLVTHPDVLIAMNEPSLHKFCASVPPGGWILYNGDELPADCEREGVHILACSFTRVADELGDSRAGNMVALGALLAIAEALPQASVDTALGRLVKSPRWLDLDERAITRGRELLHEWLEEVPHAV
jgi:2-oxoisovalerate ferredoxin oxidoreductase beta subunit